MGASRILDQTRFPMHHRDNWFRSWLRIQKRPHGDARGARGDRPGWTQNGCIRKGGGQVRSLRGGITRK